MTEQHYIIVRGNGMKLIEMHLMGNMRELRWSKKLESKYAVRFNKEEALETIQFITNIIDWELGEELRIIPIT